MKTKYLDMDIRNLECQKSMDELTNYGLEKLIEYKKIRKKLNEIINKP